MIITLCAYPLEALYGLDLCRNTSGIVKRFHAHSVEASIHRPGCFFCDPTEISYVIGIDLTGFVSITATHLIQISL